MKLSFVLIIAVGYFMLPGSGYGQAAKSQLADVSWISGCWETKVAGKDLEISEQWMKPGGGMMIGAGRTIKAGKTVDYEFIRIVEEADGIFYVAKPTANKDETRFKLVKASASEVVFENLTHNFPQRIMYRRDGEKLHARIEGTREGKIRGIDFPYTRARCE
jgi:hypothetical protein